MSQKKKRQRQQLDPAYLLRRHESRKLRANSDEDRIHLAAVPVGDLVAGKGEADGSRVKKFSMLAYSGGPLYIANFRYPVIVDLNGVKISEKRDNVNVTLDHKGDQRVGNTTSIDITAEGIKTTGVTSASSDARDEVIESAADGFIWQASIEGRVVNKTLVKAGNSVRVNGRTFRGPIYVARKFVLSAISFVTSGGDEENVVQLAAQSGESEMTFAKWLESLGLKDLTESQIEGLQKAHSALFPPENDKTHDKKPAAKDAPVEKVEKDPVEKTESKETEKVAATIDVDAVVKEIRQKAVAEEKRISKIQKICGTDHPQIRAKAIEDEWTVEKTEIEVLRAERQDVNTSILTESDNDDAPSQYDVLTAALCVNSGVSAANLDYPERVMDAATSGENQNLTLHRLMYDSIRAAGMSFRPGNGNDSLIAAAAEAERRLQAAGAGFSTISLSGVLGNVANKALLAAYNAVQTIALQLSGTRSVNDFKLHTNYRVETRDLLQELGPDGEIKHTIMTESSYTNQLKTYARMLALTRHDMINDDLGALTKIATSFGRVSAKTLDHAWHTLLLANTGSFFSSGNANYLDGTPATVLAIDALTTAAALFLDFLDASGHPMMVMPQTLLVSNANDVVAQQLHNDLFVNESTTANKPKPSNNPHVGKYKPVTSPWLNLSTITGNSDLAWYLFADPSEIAAIEIAFLRNQRTPTIESSDTVFNTLGMQWRAYFDFGIAFQDPKGAVKMKGAAA